MSADLRKRMEQDLEDVIEGADDSYYTDMADAMLLRGWVLSPNAPEPRYVNDHPFVGVDGHPDDDECTNRAGGTDETYCSRSEADHEESTR